MCTSQLGWHPHTCLSFAILNLFVLKHQIILSKKKLKNLLHKFYNYLLSIILKWWIAGHVVDFLASTRAFLTSIAQMPLLILLLVLFIVILCLLSSKSFKHTSASTVLGLRPHLLSNTTLPLVEKMLPMLPWKQELIIFHEP